MLKGGLFPKCVAKIGLTACFLHYFASQWTWDLLLKALSYRKKVKITNCSKTRRSWQLQQASWLPVRRSVFFFPLAVCRSTIVEHHRTQDAEHRAVPTAAHEKTSVYSALFLITASLNSRCNFPLCIHLNTNTDT